MATAAKKKPAPKPAAKPTTKATAKPAAKPAPKTASKKPAGKVVSLVPESKIAAVPLKNLTLSATYNVRTQDNSDIKGLAANIKAIGLKQNLIVVPVADAKGKPTSMYEVSAGGRRYRALKLLEEQQDITGEYLVHCEIETPENAVISSAAENIQREPMHPADQYHAFRRMIEGGKSIEDTAASFGTTPAVVKQRLKLADVAPFIIQKYRDGEISLEAVTAYALVDSQELQESVFFGLGRFAGNVGSIRSALTQHDISSKDEQAKYVGAEAYEAAGGTIRRDLFSDEFWFTDAKLLRQLANEKLGKAASKVKKEGWGFADIKPSMEWHEKNSLEFIEPSLREPNKEEAAKLADIEARRAIAEKGIEEAESAIDKAEDGTDTDSFYYAMAANEDALEALETEEQEVNDGRAVYTEEQKQASGAILTIENGRTKIYRAVRKEGDKPVRNKANNNDQNNGESEAAAAATIPQSLSLRLQAQRSLGLQVALANRPSIALAMVTAELLRSMQHTPGSIMNLHGQGSPVSRFYSAYQDDPAYKELTAMQEKAASSLPEECRKDPVALVHWLLTQPSDVVVRLLAVAVAQNIDADLPQNNRYGCQADAFADLLGLDMRLWWTADAKNYLSSVPMPFVERAVTEACGEEAGKQVSVLKKKDAVAMAASKLEGTGWLPEILRTMPAAKKDEAADVGGEE